MEGEETLPAFSEEVARCQSGKKPPRQASTFSEIFLYSSPLSNSRGKKLHKQSRMLSS